jgi:hypothetical protein
MSRNLLEALTPAHWDSQEPAANSGFERMRWLQGLNDLLNRPVNNRLTAQTSGTAIAANGTAQSSGVGLGPMQPKRYAEFTVKARVTFNLNSAGPAYLYVYRTLGAIPVNGAAPNAGDVIVGGDAFTGGPVTAGVNQSASLSFLDAGLDVTKRYSYYFAVKAPNGNTLNLINASQLLVMERS